ncbi:MAG: class II aldolase/adducin family protein [Anaerolineaceae bacterium]|nr:class II aldolase/adducin family protein [Anaerolineaceae bacterium]
MQSIQSLISYVGQIMFERRLTDFSGGNISVRDGDLVYITPKYSGSRQHWDVDPGTIVSGLVETDEILENPNFSREGKAHLSVYRNFPEVNGIVHAHPFYVLPFCAAERQIEPVLESTEKFGVIEVLPFAPAHSQELADYIVAGLRGKEPNIRKQAAAVLMAKHGIFAAGKDVLAALDAVERINWNAFCILAKQWIPA